MQDEVIFYGHPNVQSFHGRTVEITREEHLTLKGDCIIGVRASKACHDIDEPLRKRLMTDCRVKIEILVGSLAYEIVGSGDSRLTLTNKHDIVIRKTNFVCPRTLSVKCDKASSDISREIVELLKDPATKGVFRITAE